MSILLYSKTGCPFVQRVKMALAYKAVAYRDLVLDPAHPPVEFSALTPIGRVPVLLEGSTVVRESNVNQERSLFGRAVFKDNRAAALTEWRQLGAA